MPFRSNAPPLHTAHIGALISAACLAVWSMVALSSHANDDSASVQLRIRNSGDVGFEHVWQGLPEAATDHDFGRIEPGQTSHWHSFPAALPHYRKTRLQPQHGRQIIDVIERSFPPGQSALAPGRYTLVYALRGDALELLLVVEDRVAPTD